MTDRNEPPKSSVKSALFLLAAVILIAVLAFTGVANGWFADWLAFMAVVIGIGCVVGLLVFVVVFVHQLFALRSVIAAFRSACGRSKAAAKGTVEELMSH